MRGNWIFTPGMLLMLLWLCGVTSSASESEDPASESEDVVIVVGAGGTEAYGNQFQDWARRWAAAAQRTGASVHHVGPPRESAERAGDETSKNHEMTDHEILVETLHSLGSVETSSPLWIVMIGHGTYQQGTANFNLRGPDISATALGELLAAATRPLVIVNCASASGPFMNALSAPGRIIVVATRDGDEQNFARFGDYLSSSLLDPRADLDHDDRVSILEAFLLASDQTAQFYDQEGRLRTEHALIDDNGDGLGTPPEFFRGTRVIAKAEQDAQPDGRLAARRTLWQFDGAPQLEPAMQQRVTEIEEALEELRRRKETLDPQAYYDQLETFLLELAEIEQGTP